MLSARSSRDTSRWISRFPEACLVVDASQECSQVPDQGRLHRYTELPWGLGRRSWLVEALSAPGMAFVGC